MNLYLIFILFGIMIFLLLNKYNNFSIGNQFSLYNKPCTCSDEFNMSFQTDDNCLYIDDDEIFETTGMRGPIRYGRARMPCEWSGNSDLITTLQEDTTLRDFYLNHTEDRFTRCREQYTNQGMCALVNGIEYYCYLIGVPVNESDIQYMVDLNIGASTDRIQQDNILFESLCKIFLKSEGISILKRDKLLPFLANNSNFSELLLNKYYLCNWDYWDYNSSVFRNHDAHKLTIYYFTEDDMHKIVILDTYWAPVMFQRCGLQNTILEMNDLSLAPMKIMAFYLRFDFFTVLSNDIIFMRNGVTLDTEILCKVIETGGVLVRSGSSLESQELLRLAKGVKFKVIERLDVQNRIRMRITSYLDDSLGEWQDLPGSGWVTLTADNSNNFKFIPDDYFTNSNYDEAIIELVNYDVNFQEFLTCEKAADSRDPPAPRINRSYIDDAAVLSHSEYLKIVEPLQTNPLFKANDILIVKILENYLLLSVPHKNGQIIVYFGDFALSSFRCDSFTLPGTFTALANNFFSIEISKYTHMVMPFVSRTHVYTNYNDPLTLHVHVPNRTIDLLKVQKMYASIEIYEEYLTENRLLRDSATACAALEDAG